MAKSSRYLLKNYNREYYYKSCEGTKYFLNGKLSRRLRTVFRYAAPRAGEKVLDIACARGEAAVESVKRGCWAWGIDYSPEAIKIANQHAAKYLGKGNKKIKFLVMDAQKLKFKNSFFDLIFMNDIAEHLYDHELKKVFKEAIRVMKPKGRLIVRTPDKKFSRLAEIVLGPFGHKECPEHINLHTINHLKSLLKGLRLEVHLYKEKKSFYFDISSSRRLSHLKSFAKILDLVFDHPLFTKIVEKTFLAEYLLQNICIVARKK